MSKISVKISSFSQYRRSLVVLLSTVSIWMLLSPTALATPVTVNVYGAPYFSLFSDRSADEQQRWMVLAPDQTLDIDFGTDRIDLNGPQHVTLRDRSGQADQFSFLNLSLSLPGEDRVSGGFVDYLMGNQAGQFSIQQVMHRTPFMRADSMLSVFFWGIDYANGVGLVLGFEATTANNTNNAVTPVNEPPIALLLLLGFGVVLLARRMSSGPLAVPAGTLPVAQSAA